MELTGITIYGIDVIYLLIGLAGLLIVSLLLNIIALAKAGGLKKRYKKFLSGKDGKSLEEEIYERFDCLDDLKSENEVLAKKIETNLKNIELTYSKMNLVKYNAFENMGGEMSFVLALLNEHNNGVLLNGMSSRNGSYIYAKEIIDGEAKVSLSKEEQRSLTECINK